jgi:hypothetical protein
VAFQLSLRASYLIDLLLHQIFPVIKPETNAVHIVLRERVHMADHTPRLVYLFYELLEPVFALEEHRHKIGLRRSKAIFVQDMLLVVFSKYRGRAGFAYILGA